jgi:hypothetical protein
VPCPCATSRRVRSRASEDRHGRARESGPAVGARPLTSAAAAVVARPCSALAARPKRAPRALKRDDRFQGSASAARLRSREGQSPEHAHAQRPVGRRVRPPPGPTSVGGSAARFVASLPPALGLEFGVRLLSASLTAPAEDARPLAARAGHHELPESERAPTIRRRRSSVQQALPVRGSRSTRPDRCLRRADETEGTCASASRGGAPVRGRATFRHDDDRGTWRRRQPADRPRPVSCWPRDNPIAAPMAEEDRVSPSRAARRSFDD